MRKWNKRQTLFFQLHFYPPFEIVQKDSSLDVREEAGELILKLLRISSYGGSHIFMGSYIQTRVQLYSKGGLTFDKFTICGEVLL